MVGSGRLEFLGILFRMCGVDPLAIDTVSISH
jgi:hypothetical protein